MRRTAIVATLLVLVTAAAAPVLAGLADELLPIATPAAGTPEVPFTEEPKPAAVPEEHPGDTVVGPVPDHYACDPSHEGNLLNVRGHRCRYDAVVTATRPTHEAAVTFANEDGVRAPAVALEEGAVTIAADDAEAQLVAVSLYGEAEGGLASVSACGFGSPVPPGLAALCRESRDTVTVDEDASGPLAVSLLGDAEGAILSASGDGDAGRCSAHPVGDSEAVNHECTGSPSLSATGRATSDSLAASGTGDAGQCHDVYALDAQGEPYVVGEECTNHAVSGTGDAESDGVAVSGTGGADGGFLSVSGRDGVSTTLV